MAGDPFSWGEGSRLVNELGSERWLAQRIQIERKARGWSQARLSREMAGVGHPIHQSAISKIEPADPDQKTGRRRSDDSGERRSVTIGEAVGFAKVFGIPLGELLLPASALKQVAIARDLAAGPDALVARDEAKLAYEQIAQRLAGLYRRDAEWRATLGQELDRAVDADNESETPEVKARMQFLRDVCVTRQQKRNKR